MKVKALQKKIKDSIRAHYVKKNDFEQLKAQVKSLRKAVATLEKRSAPVSPEPKTGETKAAKAVKPAAKKAPRPKPSTDRDNLTQIKGIGPVLEARLLKLGITRIAQIAAWTQEDIDNVSAHLDFKGRIEREEWVKQAATLVPSGE